MHAALRQKLSVTAVSDPPHRFQLSSSQCFATVIRFEAFFNRLCFFPLLSPQRPCALGVFVVFEFLRRQQAVLCVSPLTVLKSWTVI